MSKRAEQAAIKAYPVVIEEHTERDLNKPRRLSYINGYEQAEKDLALTWEDVKKILMLTRISIANALPHVLSDEELAKEVLKRFNEQRKK